jgi:hypothetical protein
MAPTGSPSPESMPHQPCRWSTNWTEGVAAMLSDDESQAEGNRPRSCQLCPPSVVANSSVVVVYLLRGDRRHPGFATVEEVPGGGSPTAEPSGNAGVTPLEAAPAFTVRSMPRLADPGAAVGAVIAHAPDADTGAKSITSAGYAPSEDRSADFGATVVVVPPCDGDPDGEIGVDPHPATAVISSAVRPTAHRRPACCTRILLREPKGPSGFRKFRSALSRAAAKTLLGTPSVGPVDAGSVVRCCPGRRISALGGRRLRRAGFDVGGRVEVLEVRLCTCRYRAGSRHSDHRARPQ